MSDKTTKSYRLDDDVVSLLDATDNATAHVQRLVRERHTRVVAAYHLLHSNGWTNDALCAAMDALNGYAGLLDHAGLGVAGIPLELHDAQRLNDTAVGKWGVSAETWHDLLADLRDRSDLSQALALLAREFWAGNGAVAQRLELTKPRHT